MQASEWWPLIPCNTDLSFLPPPPSIQPPVTANSASSLTTALFIPKISSMEQIGIIVHFKINFNFNYFCFIPRSKWIRHEFIRSDDVNDDF